VAHYSNKNVFGDRRNLLYTISPPLLDKMKDCSIVRVQQLPMLYRRRCCMSASQRWQMCVKVTLCSFDSEDSADEVQARSDGEMPDSDRWTSVAT